MHEARQNGRSRFLRGLLILFGSAVLLVVLLVGLLGKFTDQGSQSPNEMRLQASRDELAKIKTALEGFYRRCKTYPSTQQGLEALRNKPDDLDCSHYEGVAQLPHEDAWGVAFKYESDGRRHRIEASHGLAIEGP